MAVLIVVFYHLQTRIRGGCVGVDVFFVISGYLISSVVLTELKRGCFSIVGFYERRIRRIFPALLAMLLCTSLLSFLFLLPSELDAFGHSLLAAIFSVSNLFFWQRSDGYFDAPSEIQPLLHTWSLSVEEQFYLLFPILLVSLQRWSPSRLKLTVWTLAITSFLLTCVVLRRDAATAFFLAPLRAWELLIGTILSQHYVPAVRGKAQRNIASMIGILLIVVPSFAYTAKTPFPGLTALPPCLGAALLISAGETGPTVGNGLLTWRPLVFIGLISYPLYLWHWPITLFQNISSILTRDHVGSRRAHIAIVAVSLVLATVSWRFVESPFRKGRFRPERRRLFLINSFAVALIAAIGLMIVLTHGVPSRFSDEALAVSRYNNNDFTKAFREHICFIAGPISTFADFRPAICLADDPTRKHYLLLGDSHGAHLYPGLSKVFPELNISQANTASCLPLLTSQGCEQMARYIYGDYVRRHHLDALLLAGRWEQSDFADLKKTIDWIKQRDIPVVLFGPVIEFDLPLPRMLATSFRDHEAETLERHRLIEPEQVDKRLANLARTEWKIRYISAYEDLCTSKIRMEATSQLDTVSGCPAYAMPGVPLLFDTNHFTEEGSILFAKVMRKRNQLTDLNSSQAN